MKKLALLAVLFAAFVARADEITFTFVNLALASFSASAAELQFAGGSNVIVTDNSTGKSVILLSTASGHTGTATDFVAGPPLIGDYNGAGAGSVLVATGSTAFLSGSMEDSGRLEAEWPNRAGAFLSRFLVNSVASSVLVSLGLPADTVIAPEGSVALTIAQTRFDGTTLTGTLGGGQITIETVPAVPEPAGIGFAGLGMVVIAILVRRCRHFDEN